MLLKQYPFLPFLPLVGGGLLIVGIVRRRQGGGWIAGTGALLLLATALWLYIRLSSLMKVFVELGFKPEGAP